MYIHALGSYSSVSVQMLKLAVEKLVLLTWPIIFDLRKTLPVVYHLLLYLLSLFRYKVW